MEKDEHKILGRTRDLQTFWSARDAKIIEEREYIRNQILQPVTIKKGFVNVRLNEAPVFFDLAVSILSGYDPKFTLPLTSQEETEKAKANKGERFFSGVYRENDRKQLALGNKRWLEQLAWYICGGWYAVFPHIETDEKDNPEFVWEVYDPITVYPRWSSGKMIELARVYWTNEDSAYQMAKNNDWILPTRSGNIHQNVEIRSYWTLENGEVENVVFIDDKLSKEITHEVEFDEIPILAGAVGGSPAGASGMSDKNWTARNFASVIQNNRGMYDQLDRWVSIQMQVGYLASHPPTIEYTKSGQPKLKPEELGAGSLIHRQIGETIDLLREATSSVDFNSVFSFINQAVQKGSVAPIVYGLAPYGESGFHGSMLFGSVERKLGPYMYALQRIIGECGIRTMRQYREGGYKSVELITNPRRGEDFIEEFNPKKDIPKATYAKVDIPFKLPLDRMQTIVAARQAMEEPAILSLETLWEQWDLGVDDKDLEFERIINDQMLRLPIMRLITVVEKLTDEADKQEYMGKFERADKIRGYATLVEEQIRSQITMGQGLEAGEGEARQVPGGRFSPERFGRSRAGERYAAGGAPTSPTRPREIGASRFRPEGV